MTVTPSVPDVFYLGSFVVRQHEMRQFPSNCEVDSRGMNIVQQSYGDGPSCSCCLQGFSGRCSSCGAPASGLQVAQCLFYFIILFYFILFYFIFQFIGKGWGVVTFSITDFFRLS